MKTELTPLEVLLLSFVTNGLTTSYDLMTQAGMPVGLTSQALQRVKKAGLLTGEIGARNSERFTLTEAGEKALTESVDRIREGNSARLARFGIFESVPRTTFLAWLYSEQKIGRDHLSWSIEQLKYRIHEKSEEADRCLREIHRLRSALPENDYREMGPVAARVHWWMKTVSDAALLKAQVEVLEQLGFVLEKMPPIAQPRAMFLESIEELAKERSWASDDSPTR